VRFEHNRKQKAGKGTLSQPTSISDAFQNCGVSVQLKQPSGCGIIYFR
jgi:hypothetical protein